MLSKSFYQKEKFFSFPFIIWISAKSTVVIISQHNINQTIMLDFPGGAVVKNLPANAGDTGTIPDPGRSHMPGSN